MKLRKIVKIFKYARFARNVAKNKCFPAIFKLIFLLHLPFVVTNWSLCPHVRSSDNQSSLERVHTSVVMQFKLYLTAAAQSSILQGFVPEKR